MLSDYVVHEIISTIANMKHLHAYKCEELMDKLYPWADCDIFTGATKICFVFKEYDYVIKTDFSKNTSYSYEEYAIYEEAKKRHLEKAFPETKIFCEKNERTFIAQEKIDYCCANLPNRLKDKYNAITKTASKKILDKMQKGFYIPDDDYNRNLDVLWASMIICLYGKAFAKNLCQLVRDYKINDLHRGNLGYKSNRPIFLDFCGYEGDYYSPTYSSSENYS